MFIPFWVLGFLVIIFLAALIKSVYLTIRIEKLEGVIEKLEGMEEAPEDMYEDEVQDEHSPKTRKREYFEETGGEG